MIDIRYIFEDAARRWLWRVLVGALVLGVIVLARCLGAS